VAGGANGDAGGLRHRRRAPKKARVELKAPKGCSVGRGVQFPTGERSLRKGFLSSKRRVLMHNGCCFFAVKLNGNRLMPLSGSWRFDLI